MDITSIWNNKRMQVFFYLCLLVAIGVAVQSVLLGPATIGGGDIQYTHYNNYVIFKYAYIHLVAHKDLYQLYLTEHWDLYKYSPAFALFFGLFAHLPDAIGLSLWNLLNALVLFAGIRSLPGIDDKKKGWIMLFCLPELILSIQNSQSNALIAGLIILAFALLERSKIFLATLCIVLTIYIKIFGVVAFALYLFYPGKLKIAAYTLFWIVVLTIIPILVVDFTQLTALYKSWYQLLANDHAASIGISAMGILQTWFHFGDSKNIVMLLGMLLFCIPLLFIKQYKTFHFRVMLLASVLIWIVIFNHKAESPTFIIAMSGMGIWYFSQTKNTVNLILLLLAFLFTALVSTDLCPGGFKEKVIKPYDVKALFPVIIWLKLSVDLIAGRYKSMGQRLSASRNNEAEKH